MPNKIQNILQEFDDKFSQSFNVGVIPDDITKERIKYFITSKISIIIKEILECLPEEQIIGTDDYLINQDVDYTKGDIKVAFNDCRSQFLNNVNKLYEIK